MSSIPRLALSLGKCVIVSLCLLLASSLSAAPAGFFQVFGEASRDIGDDVTQLADGGYAIVGSTLSYSAGNFDVWVIRLDENGDLLWQRTYGGADNEFAYSVIPSGDGGIVFTAFIGAGSFGGSAQDAWVVRLDAVGDIVWQKIFTGPGFDQIRAVKRLPDGSYALTGFVSPAFSPLDLWMARVSSSGLTMWEKIYPAAAVGFGLAVSADGDLLVTGITDDSPADVFLSKIDSVDGTVIWANTYGGSGTDRANDLVELPGGSIVVSGETDSFGLADDDSWVFRTDSSGTVEWQVSFGGVGNDGASGVGFIDNQVVIAGSEDFSSGAGTNFGWMARLDAMDGTLLWRRTMGGMDGRNTGLGLDVTFDGGAVAVGTMNTGTAPPVLGDVYISKIDAIGTVLSCPLTVDAPVVTAVTGAAAVPFALTGFNVSLGEILSSATPSNAPITNALICLADPVIFLADLSGLVLSLGLPKGLTSGLTAKLADAERAISDANPNNDRVAVNELEEFIDQVNAQRGKKLTDAEADELIDMAQQILAFLQN